jgi:hypothetical protein
MATLCPEGCWCEPGGYYVDCSVSSLNKIPSLHLIDAHALKLKFNSIPSLENDSFVQKSLTELELISLMGCELETIELGAFNGLTKLEYLLLQYNSINEIIPGTFQEMILLKYIDLGFNIIEHLEVDVFTGLINLWVVDLRGNNLKSLHPDVFIRLPHLEIVDLNSNPGLKIPTDRHFISSHSLKSLYISECNISSVSVETFAIVTALELLDLSINNLRSVETDIFEVLPKLSTMYLDGNPLQCDCQLLEAWRWCQDHNIQTVYEEAAPECDTPSEVQGIWWGVLEKAECSESNISYDSGYDLTRYDLYEEGYRKHKNFNNHILLPITRFFFVFGTTGHIIILIIIICNKDM